MTNFINSQHWLLTGVNICVTIVYIERHYLKGNHMSEISIYGLLDPRTNKFFYVGSSGNPEYRHTQHKKYSTTSPLMRRKIQSIHDAGLDFKFIILEKCDYDARDNRELHWIIKLRSEGNSLLNFLKPTYTTRKKKVK